MNTRATTKGTVLTIKASEAVVVPTKFEIISLAGRYRNAAPIIAVHRHII